jgi:hypothetical protein
LDGASAEILNQPFILSRASQQDQRDKRKIEESASQLEAASQAVDNMMELAPTSGIELDLDLGDLNLQFDDIEAPRAVAYEEEEDADVEVARREVPVAEEISFDENIPEVRMDVDKEAPAESDLGNESMVQTNGCGYFIG